MTVELNLAFYPDYFMGDFAEKNRDVPTLYISVSRIDGDGVLILYESDEVENAAGLK